MSINWEGIAIVLDSIRASGTHRWTESGGAEVGRRALASILTEHELETLSSGTWNSAQAVKWRVAC
jgi:hypothetical protein